MITSIAEVGIDGSGGRAEECRKQLVCGTLGGLFRSACPSHLSGPQEIALAFTACGNGSRHQSLATLFSQILRPTAYTVVNLLVSLLSAENVENREEERPNRRIAVGATDGQGRTACFQSQNWVL